MKGFGQHVVLLLCLVLALAVSGCVQTTAENFTKPAGPAAGNPFVLSGAASGGTAPPAAAPGEPAPSTNQTAAPAATAKEPSQPAAAAAGNKQPMPTTASEPLPVSAPATGPANAAPAGSKTANSFPNINVPPQEPSGTLLPPDERKRIISELEALRDGQSKPPKADEAPATLTKEAETHGEEALKKIKKCSQEGAAEKYPECAPAKTADQTSADPAPAN